MSNIPVAGVDVSKTFSDMCILSPDNIIFKRVKIYHDLTSMILSLEPLADAEKAFGVKPVIVMESTSHYHRLLWKFLSEAGYEIVVINPLQSGGLKNISVRKVKNDKVDAYRIATLYRLNALRPSIMPVQEVAALRALTRQHCDIKKDITRYTNRLTAILDQVFPGYQGMFSNITAKGSLCLLDAYPTPRDLLCAGESVIAALLAHECRCGRKWAQAKALKIIQTAETAVRLSIDTMSDAILIRTCIATLRLLFSNVKAIDDEMLTIVRNDSVIGCQIQLLQTIPGIGEYSAIVLLAEMGDPTAFRKPKQLAAYFGLDPSERQSGKFRGTRNKLSKRGSPYVRAILNMAAHNCIHKTRKGQASNPVLAAYYEKKHLSKPHKVALCAVMHKIVNIVFAVLRDQKPFELRSPKEHDRMLRERSYCPAA